MIGVEMTKKWKVGAGLAGIVGAGLGFWAGSYAVSKIFSKIYRLLDEHVTQSYICLHCSYSTSNLADILRHLTDEHPDLIRGVNLAEVKRLIR